MKLKGFEALNYMRCGKSLYSLDSNEEYALIKGCVKKRIILGSEKTSWSDVNSFSFDKVFTDIVPS